ncbi:MAG: hypothetical protein WC208_16140 [Gallionella sp.]
MEKPKPRPLPPRLKPSLVIPSVSASSSAPNPLTASKCLGTTSKGIRCSKPQCVKKKNGYCYQHTATAETSKVTQAEASRYVPDKLDDNYTIIYPEDVLWVRPINSQYQTEIIWAYMGHGKTVQGLAYVNSLPMDATILMITPRRSLARCDKKIFSVCDEGCPHQCKIHLCNKLFTSYLDDKTHLDDAELHPRVIIQAESLHLLKGRKFDYVLVDECESVFQQMTATTHGNWRRVNQLYFCSLLKDTKQVILLDAFLSKKATGLLDALGIRYRIHKYLRKGIRRRAEEFQWLDHFISDLAETLKAGKKCFFFCTDKGKLINRFLQTIRLEIPGIRIKEYHSDSPMTSGDVNGEWVNYDLVACTSTITVGCNFDVKEYFHQSYAYLHAGTGVLCRDACQAHMRIRHLVDNVLKYYIDDSCRGYKNEVSRSTSEIGIRKDVEKHISMMREAYRDYIGIGDILDGAFIPTNEAMTHLFVHNIYEQNNSVFNIRDVWLSILGACNYEIYRASSGAELIEIAPNDEAVIIPAFSDIVSITPDEYEVLFRKQAKGLVLDEVMAELQNKLTAGMTLTEHEQEELGFITTSEVFKILKFRFQARLKVQDPHHVMTPAEKVATELWWVEFNKPDGQKKFHTLCNELGMATYDITIEEYARHGGLKDVFDRNEVEKLEAMSDLRGLLGMSHSEAVGTIPREVITKLLPDIKEMAPRLRKAYKFKDRRSKEDKKNNVLSLKAATGLISAFLEAHCFNSLQAGERKQKRLGTSIVDVTPLVLKTTAPGLYDNLNPDTDQIKRVRSIVGMSRDKPVAEGVQASHAEMIQ